MRKWFLLIISISVIFVLTGCAVSNRNEAVQAEQKEALELPELPSLAFTNGDSKIKTIRGAFKWTVVNEKTGETVTSIVDIVAPPGLVNIVDAMPFSISQ